MEFIFFFHLVAQTTQTKAKRTCVLLGIGEQEREIQNAQVNFIKVRRQNKSDLYKCKL